MRRRYLSVWNARGHMTERKKKPTKPKLTDAERSKRFLDTAKKVGASKDPKDFTAALKRVVKPKEK